jgi:hypothetical protein
MTGTLAPGYFFGAFMRRKISSSSGRPARLAISDVP